PSISITSSAIGTSPILAAREQAINLELEFVYSLVRIIHAAIKDHIQDNPTVIVGVLINELLRVTVRLDLFAAPQFDQLGAILANRCPTTSSRQGALRVIVMRLPEIHRRNKTAITIRRILHNALKLLIKRVLRHGRTTHVSPRRSINELAQARSRSRRILRLRVPAGLPSNNVIESLPPGTALNRPPLSLSPRLTAFSPDTSRYNVFNVARRALNEVGNHAGLRLNPLDRCLNHFLSTRTNELSETAITDTLFDFVEQF